MKQLDNNHRGKAAQYCQLMLEENPARMQAVCVLANTEDLEVFVALRNSKGSSDYEVRQSHGVKLEGKLQMGITCFVM